VNIDWENFCALDTTIFLAVYIHQNLS